MTDTEITMLDDDELVRQLVSKAGGRTVLSPDADKLAKEVLRRMRERRSTQPHGGMGWGVGISQADPSPSS
jgi:hypothetical protein